MLGGNIMDWSRFSRVVTVVVLAAMVVALVPALSTADAAGGVMAYGDVVFGQINDKNYFEVWEFEGSRGDRVQILMEGSDGLDAYVGLIDAATEQVLAEDDDSGGNTDAFIEMSLPATGTYWIVATRYDLDTGTSQGSYELALTSSSTSQSTTNTSATTSASSENPVELEPGVFFMGDLVLSEPVGNTIADDSFAHMYGLELEKGTELVVAMVADGSNLDAYVVFLTEDGDVLAEDDDSGADVGAGDLDAFISLTVPQTGLYFVIATRSGMDSGKSSGDYALIAGVPEDEGPVQSTESEDELPPGMEAFGTIETGMTASETISDDSYFHIYGFEGQAGDEITITMRGEDGLDAYLGLIDPSDEVLAEDDDSAGGLDAQISISLPESGNYLIIASRSGLDVGTTVGGYTLEVIAGPPATAADDEEPLSFTGLPGRALMNDSGETFYLSGNGRSADPAKSSPLEVFGSSDLPGRTSLLHGLGTVSGLRQNISLNFEEIKFN
jgi:phosphotransferase system HPr-like phosphotransfer protein